MSKTNSDGVDVTAIVGSALTSEERGLTALLEDILEDSMNRKVVLEAEKDRSRRKFQREIDRLKARIDELEREADREAGEIQRNIDGCDTTAAACSDGLARIEGVDPSKVEFGQVSNVVSAELEKSVAAIHAQNEEQVDV